MAASTTAAGGVRLAQEIHDEFLVCKICLDSYRNPKCLACLHTFCEQCIDNHVNSESSYKKYSDYREFTCPLCRKRTQLPVGGVKKLPDNFLVSSLTEVTVTFIILHSSCQRAMRHVNAAILGGCIKSCTTSVRSVPPIFSK